MKTSFQITGTYTDQYQLTMAQAYFLRDKVEEKAVFDYFFRSLPYSGGYAIFSGLEDILDILEHFQFSQDDIHYIENLGFERTFIEYLKTFTFKGSVHSIEEGNLVFPYQPILRVEGHIIEVQIIETVLLNILNFQTLIATKASRMRLAAGSRMLMDFGMRRAHAMAAYHASRAAFVGGFDMTSNVKSAMDFGIPVSGTMAHAFIQSFDREIDAFRHFAKIWPDNCILLVDTYNTLSSGLPNVITVAKEMQARGKQLKGIRLDSGDLAFLAKKSRQLLDKAGLFEVKIFVSNQLDEYVIKSLLNQQAPIDGFGVGTKLVTGQPDAALGGVYKLAYAYKKSRIKLSENVDKTTLPHKKQVYRVFNKHNNMLGADAITLSDEKEINEMYHPFYNDKKMSLKDCLLKPLLMPVMVDGRRTLQPKSVSDIAIFSKQKLQELPDEYKRFDNPHLYKVGLSKKLLEEKNNLINKIKSQKEHENFNFS